MSLWLRQRDLRTHLYMATVIKFLVTYVYIFLIPFSHTGIFIRFHHCKD